MIPDTRYFIPALRGELLDSRTKKELKTMLDVSYPTIRDYEERADNDIERANATLELTYEDA